MLYRTYQPKEQVMKPDKNGMVTDHYTGEKIRYSEAEKGHLMYYEHRYMKEAAERMNMSQKQFNRMNKCSEVLVAQKKENNRGRGFECQDDSVGFNTSLNHIAQYLKYGKSKQEQAAIDKQVQQARISYYKEHQRNSDRSRSKKPVSTQRESLLTPENKLNYEKLDAYLAKDKARAAKLANRKAKGSMKKKSSSKTSKTKSSASVRYSVSRSKANGHTGKGGRSGKGGGFGKGGVHTGGKGIGSGQAGAHGGTGGARGGIGGARGSVGSGGAHTGGGHTGGGGKGGH